jgi:hypothetical protein
MNFTIQPSVIHFGSGILCFTPEIFLNNEEMFATFGVSPVSATPESGRKNQYQYQKRKKE